MLEVGAVVHARRQHDHGRVDHARRRDRAQRLEQQVRVVRDRRDAVRTEQFGEQPHHHLAVLEHVAHTAGHAQVVLEHVVAAAAVGVAGTHDVDAGDVRVDAAGHVDAAHLAAVLRVVQHLLLRHDAGVEDALLVVDVVDEVIQRGHALRQPLLHLRPLVFRDDARNQVEGNQPLGSGAVLVLRAVHGEGDADAAKDHLGLGAAVPHQVVRLLAQPALVAAVVLTDLFAFGQHFVEAGLHASGSWAAFDCSNNHAHRRRGGGAYRALRVCND